ncbi:MAG: DUF805 domain-containing protein, partial [Muribaculaceae bacterium]|nr:DUF805 domain-containing protein [Muribaculaceae bacterium]
STPLINQIRVPFEESVKSAFKDHFCDFNGRASRSDFWWPVLAVAGASAALTILMIICGAIYGATYGGFWKVCSWIFDIVLIIVQLGSILPILGLGVRRLHDIGKPGILILIGLIPFVGLILFYWWAQESEPYPNQYGNVPHLNQ